MSGFRAGTGCCSAGVYVCLCVSACRYVTWETYTCWSPTVDWADDDAAAEVTATAAATTVDTTMIICK